MHTKGNEDTRIQGRAGFLTRPVIYPIRITIEFMIDPASSSLTYCFR